MLEFLLCVKYCAIAENMMMPSKLDNIPAFLNLTVYEWKGIKSNNCTVKLQVWYVQEGEMYGAFWDRNTKAVLIWLVGLE